MELLKLNTHWDRTRKDVSLERQSGIYFGNSISNLISDISKYLAISEIN